jgi:CxxC motif-containing protein (DUF1111 family)
MHRPTFCAAIAVALTASAAYADPNLPPRSGGPLPNLSNGEAAAFAEGKSRFTEIEDVSRGLGPLFNLDSCASCHSSPAIGGSCPAVNPEIAAATANGASNTIPSFITANGPVREARFKSDGGVHDLFTITGRGDAPGCIIAQPDFSNIQNLSFRIPTPLFGLGLVQNTSDQTLIADAAVMADKRNSLHIAGHFNHSSNDGTISRFGWKAQNKSITIFVGEAYNVEMGVTNLLFPNEREDDPNCQFTTKPEDHPAFGNDPFLSAMDDVTGFAAFINFLDAPRQAMPTASITNGQQVFSSVGCDTCHIPSHATAPSNTVALNLVTFFPYSDFQLHDIGTGDDISQGEADGNEFRTAPLWGAGQRLFFLHDGSASNMLQAINAHAGEAQTVINNFNRLTQAQQLDLLNFLSSL